MSLPRATLTLALSSSLCRASESSSLKGVPVVRKTGFHVDCFIVKSLFVLMDIILYLPVIVASPPEVFVSAGKPVQLYRLSK